MSSFKNNLLPIGLDGIAYNSKAKGVLRLPLNAGLPNNGVSASRNYKIDVGTDWTSVHKAPAGVSMDEVYLWACRDPQFASTDPATLFLAGAFWSIFNLAAIEVDLSSGTGLQLVLPGVPIGGQYADVSEIKAKGSDNINVFGFVVRRFKKDPNDSKGTFGYNGEEG